MTEIKIARVYDAPAEGTRVLVDRLWPRGVGKEDAPFDEWLQQVAPSTNLRIWYGHRREHFDEFRTRYAHELEAPETREALDTYATSQRRETSRCSRRRRNSRSATSPCWSTYSKRHRTARRPEAAPPPGHPRASRQTSAGTGSATCTSPDSSTRTV